MAVILGRSPPLGSSSRRRAACAAAAIALSGCSATLTRDGQLAFTEGRPGAAVITANGVELLDRADVPRPVVRKSAFEPWRAPTGFLIPADGVWRATSTPVPMQGPGLGVLLRASDALAPAWGGEILVRLDAIAPAAAFPAAAGSVRAPVRIAIVIDARGAGASALASDAIGGLGARDRVAIVDAAGARIVVPAVPGSHRTLLEAAAARVAAAPARPRDLPAALAVARRAIDAPPADPGPAATTRVLVLTDGDGVRGVEDRVAAEVRAIGPGRVTAVASTDAVTREAIAALGDDVHAGGALEAREEIVIAAVPAPGDVALRDVTLTIASSPAPARVIEVSGGQATLGLDHDRVRIGDLAAGEARTEVARVAVPAWVSGEPLEITVRAEYVDAASGRALSSEAHLALRYASDVEAIASSRRGDVIAYASALAMVRRLDRAFAGGATDALGGLGPLVDAQARSMALLAKTNRDPALGAQAEVLRALLGALPE